MLSLPVRSSIRTKRLRFLYLLPPMIQRLQTPSKSLATCLTNWRFFFARLNWINPRPRNSCQQLLNRWIKELPKSQINSKRFKSRLLRPAHFLMMRKMTRHTDQAFKEILMMESPLNRRMESQLEVPLRC